MGYKFVLNRYYPVKPLLRSLVNQCPQPQTTISRIHQMVHFKNKLGTESETFENMAIWLSKFYHSFQTNSMHLEIEPALQGPQVPHDPNTPETPKAEKSHARNHQKKTIHSNNTFVYIIFVDCCRVFSLNVSRSSQSPYDK